MVVLHIKKSEADGFLYETTCDTSNDTLIRELVSKSLIRCFSSLYSFFLGWLVFFPLLSHSKPILLNFFASSSTNQHLYAIFRYERQIYLNYTQFLAKLSGRYSSINSASVKPTEISIHHRLGEIGLRS